MFCSSSVSICLCIFMFVVCCLQNVESDERLLFNHGNGLNNSTDISDAFLTKNGNSHMPNSIGRHSKHVIFKTTAVGDSAINTTDQGHNIRTQVDLRQGLISQDHVASTSVTSNKRHSGLTTSQPLHRISVNRSRFATTPTRKYFVTPSIVNRPINNSRKYDVYIHVGTTYLCDSGENCEVLLENSICLPNPDSIGMDHCECIRNYIYDGEQCIEKGSIYFCSSHEDCGILEGSRCNYLTSTYKKICRCQKNFVTDKHKCLPKVQHLEFCISSKQCPRNLPCLTNVCRLECSSGYSWKYDRCVIDIKSRNHNEESILFNPVILFSIIGGIPMIMLVLTVVILMRRRMLGRSCSTSANNSLGSRMENSAASIPSSHSLISDQPPSYNEVITASTATLTTNAQEMCEDPPPSYERCGEASFNK